MSEKILVPEGMLKAAHYVCDDDVTESEMRKCLEVALRWLSENPIVPTDEDYKNFGELWSGCGGKSFWTHGAVDWQRRMFLAPEETLPPDLIDLIHGKNEWTPADVLEAFRRGQRSRG